MTSQTSPFADEQQEANRQLAAEALVLLSTQPRETPVNSDLVRTRRLLPGSTPKRPVRHDDADERQPKRCRRDPPFTSAEAEPRANRVCPYIEPSCECGDLVVEAISSAPDKEMSVTLLNSYFRINYPWYAWGPRTRTVNRRIRNTLGRRTGNPFEQVPGKPWLWRVKASYQVPLTDLGSIPTEE